MSLLHVKKLEKTFCDGSICVAKSIDLDVNEGEIFTLMGKSGCGKSSLLRMICGFETPCSGEIILGGKTLFGKGINLETRDRELAIVFQNYALFPHMSVAQNILFGVEKEGKGRLDALLEKTGISAIKTRFPHEISGGQQQRVALCRALIRQPKLLLLDEPFSSVDSELRASLRDELKQMIKAFGITSIFVTHDREDAFHMSDRVALMAQGEILQVGEVEALYKYPKNKACAQFLGKINVYEKEGKEVMFRPADVHVNTNGALKGEVKECIFHGFFYVVLVQTQAGEMTLFTKEPHLLGAPIAFDVLNG
ncbi:MAG: ABC transporter ATP-binding protein [Campylobacterales bacterium]|nr:ABC transporter ATP-binding protein [Campylobacterales bacterium]